MHLLKQSTAATVFVGPVLDSTGAAYTGMTNADFSASKDGAAAYALSTNAATVTHIANGIYTIALTTTDTDTKGRYVIYCNKSTYAMSMFRYQVLLPTVFDALVTNATTAAGGLGDIQRMAGTALTGRDIGASVLLSSGTGTGQISLSSGAVTVGTNNDKTGYTASTVSDKTGYSLSSSQSFNLTGSITGNLSGSVGSIASGGITAASFAAGAIDAAAIATDAITSAELSSTATAEIAAAVWDLTVSGHTTGGTFGAAMNAAGSAGDPWATSLPGAYTSGTAGYILGNAVTTAAGIRTAIGLASANLDTQLSTIAGYIDTEVAAIYNRIGAPAGASIAADIAAIKTETAAILDDTGTSGVVVASGSKTGYSLAAAGLDSIVVESGLNARQAISLNTAALAGVLSGAATTTVVIKGAGVATTRITATVDTDNNRTAVTLNPPA